MRAGFGLVSLLVVAAICLFMFKMFEAPTIERGKQIHDQVQPLSGKTADGLSAEHSVKMDGVTSGGTLRALRVTEVTPGGYYEQYFGLHVGDEITKVGDQDMANFEQSMAEALVWEAAARGGTITVRRDGRLLTLRPEDGTSGKPTPNR